MIIQDVREPDRIRQLLSKRKVEVTRDFIEVADYLLSDGYAVERKDDDLIQSIKNHRLWEQLNNLCQYEHPILAYNVENLWKLFYYSQSNYVHKQYVGALTTITIKYPSIKLIPFSGEDQLIDILESLEKKIHDTGDTKKPRPKPAFRRASKMSEKQENSIACATGVGIGTSKTLLTEAGSIKDLASMTEEELSNIKGIGKKTANNVFKLLNEPYTI